MKLINAVELIESSIGSPKLNVCHNKPTMMKSAEDGVDAISVSPKDHPNGQIKRPEPLNGATTPVKKMLDISKSPLSFEMTVKKVTLPAAWETLSFSSSDENLLQHDDLANGIPCGNEMSSEDFLVDEDGDRTSSVGLDFVDDSEKFGLSDSEVDKLLADVEDKEDNSEDEKEKGPSKAVDNSTKEINGTDDSRPESRNETAADETTCRKPEDSDNLPELVNDCDGDGQSDGDQINSSSEDHKDGVSNHLKEDVEKSIECEVNSSDNFTAKMGEDVDVEGNKSGPVDDITTGNPDSQLEECRERGSSANDESCEVDEDHSAENNCMDVSDEHIHDNVESSRSVSDEELNKDKENNDALKEVCGTSKSKCEASSNKDEICETSKSKYEASSNKDEVCETSKSKCEASSNKDDSGDLSQTKSNDSSAVSHKPEDSLCEETVQSNEREKDETVSSDIENDSIETNEVDVQDDHIDPGDKPESMEVDCIDIVDDDNVGVESIDGDLKSASEAVVQNEDVGKVDDSESCIEDADSADKHDQLDVNETVEDLPRADVEPVNTSEKTDEIKSDKELADDRTKDTEAVPVRSFIRVKTSSELQAISTDSQEKVVEQNSTVGSSLSAGTVGLDKSDIVCDTMKSVSEHKDGLNNKEVERAVRKRSSNDDVDDDDARENKRTRVEVNSSESSERTSECDKVGVESDESTKPAENKVSDTEVKEKKDSELEASVSELSSESVEVVNVNNDVENGEKVVSDVDKEKCALEQDKQENSENDEARISGSKRPNEQVGLIEVKKVRFTPEMEKQLRMVEKKLSTSSNSGSDGGVGDSSEGKKEPQKPCSSEETKKTEKVVPERSYPPTEPKSNLDLAIERVVAGITDGGDKSNEPEEPRKLNPLPIIRDLHQNLLKKLSRNDLEELVVQKLCEVVTERCTLGEVRQRCQTLEQTLDQWRKKAQQLQKQLKDMEMVMRRYMNDARTRKDRPVPVKITRSVGLQVNVGSMGPGMMRNRTLGGDVRTSGPIRRRINRTSPPPPSGAVTQSQQQQQQQAQQHKGQQQQQQQQQTQPMQQQQQQQPRQTQPMRSPTPVTVQKVVTPGFTKLTTATPAVSQAAVPRPPLPALVASSPAKIAPMPPKPVMGRPAVVTTTVGTTIASPTSTVNTVVNTTTNLRIASASQLNSRQPPKPSIVSATKSGPDHKVIDLTDEEDKAKTTMGIMRNIISAATTLPSTLVSSASSAANITVSSSPSIQTGSIRVVQPHQLTGSTTTTILAPSSSAPASRLAYLVPTTGGAGQQRQVFIASSASQVRPGIMTMSSRQNQLPTLVFKGGTVVPIQQASGTGGVNSATIIRPGSVQTGSLQQMLNPRPGQPLRVPSSLVQTVGRMTTPTLTSVAPVLANKHPAPLPNPPPYQPSNVNWKFAPPKPELKIAKASNKQQQGIVLSWNMQLTSDYEEIASYQLYAYQEGAAQPSTTLWKKVGDVKALPLPMACTLTQFMEGHKYHFAVRAVDVHTRVGPFSTPGNIVLTRK